MSSEPVGPSITKHDVAVHDYAMECYAKILGRYYHWPRYSHWNLFCKLYWPQFQWMWKQPSNESKDYCQKQFQDWDFSVESSINSTIYLFFENIFQLALKRNVYVIISVGSAARLYIHPWQKYWHCDFLCVHYKYYKYQMLCGGTHTRMHTHKHTHIYTYSIYFQLQTFISPHWPWPLRGGGGDMEITGVFSASANICKRWGEIF